MCMAAARTLLINYLLEGNLEERISYLNSSRSQQTANSDSIWGTIARQAQSRGAAQHWENLWRCWKKNRNEIIARASVQREKSSAMSCNKTTSSHSLPGINSVWPVVYVITSDTSQLGSVMIDSSGTPSLLPVADDSRLSVGSQPFLVYDENGILLNNVSIEEHEFVVSDHKDIVALPPRLVRVPANGSQLVDFCCIHGGFPKSICQADLTEFSAQRVPVQTESKPNFSSPLVYSACPRTAGTMDINFRCPVVVCDRLDAVCSSYGLQQSTCNHSPTCHEVVIEDVRTIDAVEWNHSALSPTACSSSPALNNHSNNVLRRELDYVTSCLVDVCNSRLLTMSDENSSRLPESLSTVKIACDVHSVDSVDSRRSVDNSQCSPLEVVDEKMASSRCRKLCDLPSGSSAPFAADQPTLISGSPPNAIPASDKNETHRLEAGCSSKIGLLHNHVASITSADSYDNEMFDRSLLSETQCGRADGFAVDGNNLVNCALEASRTHERMPASVGLHGEPIDQFETPTSSGFAVNLMGSNDLSHDASTFVCLKPEDASDQVTTLHPVSEFNVAYCFVIQPDVNMAVQNGISTAGLIEDNVLPDTSHTNCHDHSPDMVSVFSIEEVCDSNLCDEVTDGPDSAIGKIHHGHCSVDLNTVTKLPSNRQPVVCDVGSMLEHKSLSMYNVDAERMKDTACSADIGAGSIDTRPCSAGIVSVVNEVSSQSCAIAAQSTRITEDDSVLADVSCVGASVDLDTAVVEKSDGETRQIIDGSDELISGDRHQDDYVDEDQSHDPRSPHVFNVNEVTESVDKCIWGLVNSTSRINCQTETVSASHNLDNKQPSEVERSEPVCTESNCSTLHSETKDAVVAGHVTAAIDEVLCKCKSNNLPSNAIQEFEKPVNDSVKRKGNAASVASKTRGACRLRKVMVGRSVVGIPRPVDEHERDLAAVEGDVAFFPRWKGQTNESSCRSRRNRLPLGPSNRSDLKSYTTVSPSAIVESVNTEPGESSLVDVSNNNIVVQHKTDIAGSDSTADMKSPPQNKRMEADSLPQSAERIEAESPETAEGMEVQGPAQTAERVKALEEGATSSVQPIVVTPSETNASGRSNVSSTRNRCRTKAAKQSLPLHNSSPDVSKMTSLRTSRARRVKFVLTDGQAGYQIATNKTPVIDCKRRFCRSAYASLSGQQLTDCVGVPFCPTSSIIAYLPDKTSDGIPSIVDERLDLEGGVDTAIEKLTNVEIQNNVAVLAIEADQPDIFTECRCALGVSNAVKPCTVCCNNNCTNSVQSNVTNFALLTSKLNSRITELQQSKIKLLSQLHLAKQQASASPDWYQVCRMTRSDFRKRKFESFEKELTSRAEALVQKELLANKKIRVLRKRDIRLNKWSKKLEYESRSLGGIVVARSQRESDSDIAATGIPSLEEIMFTADIKPMSFQLDEEEMQQQRAKLEQAIETVIANSKRSSSVRHGDEPADGSDGIECKFGKSADASQCKIKDLKMKQRVASSTEASKKRCK